MKYYKINILKLQLLSVRICCISSLLFVEGTVLKCCQWALCSFLMCQIVCLLNPCEYLRCTVCNWFSGWNGEKTTTILSLVQGHYINEEHKKALLDISTKSPHICCWVLCDCLRVQGHALLLCGKNRLVQFHSCTQALWSHDWAEEITFYWALTKADRTQNDLGFHLEVKVGCREVTIWK